jgi:hypothetical protein
MSDPTKNARPSSSEKGPKNAGGIDDIAEGEDRVEGVERVERDDGRRADGDRQSGIEKPNSTDGRRSSER